MDKNPFQRIIQGIGVIAEISVLFYKAAINAGASEADAAILTRVFLDSMINFTGNIEEQ